LIRELRSQQLNSSSHQKLPMAEAGKCVTEEVDRRSFPPLQDWILVFALHSPFLTRSFIFNNPIFFINIVERLKTDIFSTCVFNNLEKLSLIFQSPLLFEAVATRNRVTYLFSVTYIFIGFSQFIAKPFLFR
jgi:hypothetical protein